MKTSGCYLRHLDSLSRNELKEETNILSKEGPKFEATEPVNRPVSLADSELVCWVGMIVELDDTTC